MCQQAHYCCRRSRIAGPRPADGRYP
jgi:hypothetical protein